MSDIDDESEGGQSLIIFGRDVSKVPCFRESFLNGILSGVVIGIGTFMRTSKPRVACNYGMASYITVTLFYWTYCRYTYSKEKFFAAQIQEGMRLHNLYQGTDKEREIREEFLKDSEEV